MLLLQLPPDVPHREVSGVTSKCFPQSSPATCYASSKTAWQGDAWKAPAALRWHWPAAESCLWSQESALRLLAPRNESSRGVSYQVISLLASRGCSVCCGQLASISWTAAACWVRREGLWGLRISICFGRPSVGLRGLSRTVSRPARKSSCTFAIWQSRVQARWGPWANWRVCHGGGDTTVTSPARWVVHRGPQPHCTAACHLQPVASATSRWVCCSA